MIKETPLCVGKSVRKEEEEHTSGSEPMTFYFSDMMFNAQTIAMGFERDSCDHRMLQGQEKKVIGFSAR